MSFIPEVSARLAAKSALSYLPLSLRRRCVSLPAPRGYVAAWLGTRLGAREAVGSVVFAPKTTTGFLLRAPGAAS
jgi:hypothetical protein